MNIGKIHLFSFRNFDDKVLSFSDKITVIVGPNGVGKTNILESINLLSSGKSFRASVESEMINYKEEIARIKGRVLNLYSKDAEKTDLEVILTRGEIGLGTSNIQKVSKKRLLVSGVPKRLVDFAGILRTVVFGPWDLDLITESPSLRRKFLDSVLSQVDREYRRAIISYEKGLRQRNKLLFRIREEGLSRGQLVFWDQLLIRAGDYISRKREELIEFINETKSFNEENYKINYDKSAISEGRLEQYKNEEVAAATTLVGPHRDDFILNVVEDDLARELSKYGSRGEQRMAILWLKMAELLFVEKMTGSKPTLLLDDIFSELDHEHRKVVMEVAKKQQTIINTADPHYIEGLMDLPAGGVERIDLE